jgi:hypothetical protein
MTSIDMTFQPELTLERISYLPGGSFRKQKLPSAAVLQVASLVCFGR